MVAFHLLMQALDTAGREVDAITLTKPARWTPNLAAAAARYAATATTPTPPSTFELYDIAFGFAPGMLAYLATNADKLSGLFGPGTAAYNIANARPGGDVVSGHVPQKLDWTVQEIWAVTRAMATFLQPLTAQQYFKPLANDVDILMALTAPGGRMYFGP
jgi:hypothetical protein